MNPPFHAPTFLNLLSRSGLLTSAQVDAVSRRLQMMNGDATAAHICDWMFEQQFVTAWQSEKLRQSKFRGFFLGPYKLLEHIARGAMSNIYSAEHIETGAIHALKVLPPSRTSQASYLPRFLREADIAQRLNHPNIVRVFGAYSESDGQDVVHFMAMELLSGHDLAETVAESGPLPVSDALNFIRQAALGLQFAHDAGLVHRDIKPGNLFLGEDGVVRLLDLGLAQDFGGDESLTRDFNERVLGTADYLAPEQAADSHTVDARADLYSLGCTLFFLLTGQPPYTEGTLVQRLIAHQTKSPPALSHWRTDVPADLESLMRALMARSRDDRPASAAAFVAELDRLVLLSATHAADGATSQQRPIATTARQSPAAPQDDGSEEPKSAPHDASQIRQPADSFVDWLNRAIADREASAADDARNVQLVELLRSARNWVAQSATADVATSALAPAAEDNPDTLNWFPEPVGTGAEIVQTADEDDDAIPPEFRSTPGSNHHTGGNSMSQPSRFEPQQRSRKPPQETATFQSVSVAAPATPPLSTADSSTTARWTWWIMPVLACSLLVALCVTSLPGGNLNFFWSLFR